MNYSTCIWNIAAKIHTCRKFFFHCFFFNEDFFHYFFFNEHIETMWRKSFWTGKVMSYNTCNNKPKHDHMSCTVSEVTEGVKNNCVHSWILNGGKVLKEATSTTHFIDRHEWGTKWPHNDFPQLISISVLSWKS